MSLFNELKRRNVFRVAIAYVVVAWLVLQVSDVILNNIEAPGWLFQAIMLVLGIGFPVVMLFAWAFELTPEGLKREHEVDRSESVTHHTGRKLDRMIIGIMAVVIAFLVLDRFVLEKDPAPAKETAQSEQAGIVAEGNAAPAGPSVAVLPFVNMSGDAENEYFSDGLTETLLHMLAQIQDLRVAARTSSFAFKGQNTSIAEIANTLGVAHILEGSVQKSGDRVRVTAQLIRAEDGFHVWSQNYTRPLEDIFAIQDEIATDVAGALDSSLLGGKADLVHSVDTHDLTAYDNYLKGLEQQAIGSYGSLGVAESQFKQALARDPDFTDARLALVRNYLLQNNTGLINNEVTRVAIEPLIQQVRVHSPENRVARALELLAQMQSRDANLPREEIEAIVTEMRNLLPLIPGETSVRQQVALALNFFFKQPQQAVETLEAGLLFDPLSSDIYSALGIIHRDQEQLEKARTALQRAIELNPEDPNNYARMSDVEREANNLVAALEWDRQATVIDPQDHELAQRIGDYFYGLNLPEEGDRWNARVNALAPGSAVARLSNMTRAYAREEYDLAIQMAQAMIRDQVEDRQGAFNTAVFVNAELMLDMGRAREGYDFLVSVRPEIADYDHLPPDPKGLTMQWSSIGLMTGFATFEERKQAWMKLAANMDAMGWPWREPDDQSWLWEGVIMGDTEAAATFFLEQRLSRPMANNLYRHKQTRKPFMQPVYDDPRVAARLHELDQEFAQLRIDVMDMLQQPEWQ